MSQSRNIWGWGSDSSGQLAQKVPYQLHNYPKLCDIKKIPQIIQISCGSEHAAFLTPEGAVYTIGSNEEGRLGINKEEVQNSPVPVLVEGLKSQKIIQISCGQFHSLALSEQGAVYSWGFGNDGALGSGSTQTE